MGVKEWESEFLIDHKILSECFKGLCLCICTYNPLKNSKRKILSSVRKWLKKNVIDENNEWIVGDEFETKKENVLHRLLVIWDTNKNYNDEEKEQNMAEIS